ncbi:kinase-like domain-containing protein [Rhizophagus irregularis DAOM 181602=DAOM 197198]|nr:kinase-like domain-containing protein [Rhizophagus irregularis DAOM 181602=DAOM 197198]
MIILPPTRRQLFADSKHDDICKEIRPEIYEPEAPKCYIDLIRRCWDPNPEIEEMIFSFQESYYGNDHEFNEQSPCEKQDIKHVGTCGSSTNLSAITFP